MNRETGSREKRYYGNIGKPKVWIKFFFVVLLLSTAVFCWLILDNVINIEYKRDVAQTPQDESKIRYSKKNVINSQVRLSDAENNISVNSEWNLILVNPWNRLPDDFSVELTTLKNGHAIDKKAYPDLQEMMDSARAEGLSPIICSSYRTTEKQKELFNNQVDRYLAQGYSKEEAEKEASIWVAVPGTSEHQTGLAVDIVALSYQILDENQANTPEQKWLMENSYKYGFILRYPEDKSKITGIGYEPWHYRYVGKEAAKQIYETGLSLEEYLSN